LGLGNVCVLRSHHCHRDRYHFSFIKLE
jgi:hypothetical protein